jgi:serine/threonine protein kinase
LDEHKNYHVALKKLKNIGEDFEQVARAEADVLKKIKEEIEHDHLIRTIAYYYWNKDHYFMFPWAQGGNLWEFWKTSTRNIDDTNNTFDWMLKQFIGLTSALGELHHGIKSNGEERNCRHGDLKPQNILCFTSNDPEQQPTLVITDVGLARLHSEATALRDSTKSSNFTKRYAPPELDTESKSTPKSRRMDIWSLGCIYLEFLIWFLYGSDGLEQFRQEVNSFYELSPGDRQTLNLPQNDAKTAKLHNEVKRWVTHMTCGGHCCANTALNSLIDLIHARMLNPRIDFPGQQDDTLTPLNRQQTYSRYPEQYLQAGSKSSQPKPASTSTVIAERDTSTPGVTISSPPITPNSSIDSTTSRGLLREDGYRAYARDVLRELQNISSRLQDPNGHEFKPMCDNHKPGTLSPPAPKRGDKSTATQKGYNLDSTQARNPKKFMCVHTDSRICRVYRSTM